MTVASRDTGNGGLRALFEQAASRALDAGVALFRQGTPAREIFLLVEGRVRLVRHAADGQTVTLHAAQAGELVAEGALFSKTYQCDAVCDAASVVKAVGTRALMRRFSADPTLALALAERLAHQLHRARALVELRNIRSAEERVLQHLRLSLPAGTDSIEFQTPLIRIASELGLTHEAYYRVLAKLVRSGRVERTGRRIRLPEARSRTPGVRAATTTTRRGERRRGRE